MSDSPVLGLDRISSRQAIFSLRTLVLFFAWLSMWQGWMVEGSIFQLDFLGEIIPDLQLKEVMVLCTFILLVLERTQSGDWTIKRTYFGAPILLLGLAMFISWSRGAFIKQEVGFVYEAHESMQLVTSYFILCNVFREQSDRLRLVLMLMFATIMKAADGAWIKAFSDDQNVSWGVLLMWRDGFLLALGIVGTMLLIHYRGRQFKWLRWTMLCVTPLLFFTLIVSYRRTFFIALLVSAVVMFATIGRERRGKHGWMILALLVGLAAAVLLTEPLGFLIRFSGVIEPKNEGSAAIRVLEYPNVFLNIYHNPIFGTPIGTLWHEYYRLPLAANFTRFGCHNTYLYWPLRTGILGTFAFFWLLGRIWKAILINWRMQKTEEDFLTNQLSIHMMVIYNTASFFGLMYSDAMNTMTGVLLCFFQLQMIHATGLTSYRHVKLFATLREKRLVFRAPDPLITLAVEQMVGKGKQIRALFARS
jgi:O-antigen ligase